MAVEPLPPLPEAQRLHASPGLLPRRGPDAPHGARADVLPLDGALHAAAPATNFIFDEQEALLANPYVRAAADPTTKIGWLEAFKRDFWGLHARPDHRLVPPAAGHRLARHVEDRPARHERLPARLPERPPPRPERRAPRPARLQVDARPRHGVARGGHLRRHRRGDGGRERRRRPRRRARRRGRAPRAPRAEPAPADHAHRALRARRCSASTPRRARSASCRSCPSRRSSRRSSRIPSVRSAGSRAVVAAVTAGIAFVFYVEMRRRWFPVATPHDLTAEANAGQSAAPPRLRRRAALVRAADAPARSAEQPAHRGVAAVPRRRRPPRLRARHRAGALPADALGRLLGAAGAHPGAPRLPGEHRRRARDGGAVRRRARRRASRRGGAGGGARTLVYVAHRSRARSSSSRSSGSVVSYFPVSNIPVVLPTVRAERFWYFPAIGTAIVLAHRLREALRARTARARAARRRSALFALFLGFQCFAARRHALDYTNDLGLLGRDAQGRAPQRQGAPQLLGHARRARRPRGPPRLERRRACSSPPSGRWRASTRETRSAGSTGAPRRCRTTCAASSSARTT